MGTYLGFVKDNSDVQCMGRLKVWIPELSSDPFNGLVTVNYCSPFAGATPIIAVNKSSQADSQTSYGFFAVPPDIDNEVIVQFINGDPNRGIWIGCLYQQFMDNMVPGIPVGPTTTSNGKETAPVQEYNKWDSTQAANPNPLRPPYVPLTTGLLNEGLMSDGNRGPSDSSARRSTKPDVLGLLSPGGSQLVLDDNPDNTFIRLRTKSGAQVLINDAIGMIYVISKNGNSWLEVGDDGINAYSASPISYRSQSDINLHADGKVNIYGQKGVTLATSAAITLQGTGAINIASGGPLNLQSQNTLSLLSQEDVAVSSGCTIGLQASCNVAVQAQQCVGVTAQCGLYLVGKPVYQNGPVGPTPGSAAQASLIPVTSKSDRELNVEKGYPELSTKTICSVMPSHEPWSGHASSGLGPESKAVNLNYQTRTQAGDYGAQPSPNDILPGQPELPPGNDTSYWVPVSGIVSSQFGPRAGGNHPGCDIARNSGNAIVATKSGSVVFAGFGQPGSGYGGYGNCVCIDHGNGLRSIYGHMMNLPAVNKGDKVAQGQFLGNVGATGNVTGPHLHFELRQGGNPFDPATVLPGLSLAGIKVTAGDPDPNRRQATQTALNTTLTTTNVIT
jgi:hypothetical protein